jgi:ubiquinone/menaquinone biosynthesis C-methylase UbiE
MPNTSTDGRSYQPVAWFYEQLSALFSFGRIHAIKATQVPELESGERVLYVAVGTGKDAALAAERGAVVTCLDLAPAMLKRARRRIERAGYEAAFVNADVMEHNPETPYDVVTANFLLNIFPEPVMPRVLAKLVELVRPGGRVMIADFAPPEGSAMARAFQFGYAGTANFTFWAMGLAPLQPVYDFRRYFPDAGLELLDTTDLRVLPFGPPAFRSLIARRS